MKEKVAIIDSLGAHGSAHHLYLYGQADGLARSGVKVSIYTNNVTENPNYSNVDFFHFYKNIFQSRSRFLSGLRYIIGSIFSIFHARFNGVKVCHYHIFHANILVFFDFILTRLLGMKVICTIHDIVSLDNIESNNILSKWIYKRANKILTHNEFSANIFKQNYREVDADIGIIPHGNYLPFIKIEKDRNNSRKMLGIPQEKKVLLFFGMIKKVKGLDVILESLKKVVLKHPDTLLVIAGKVWKDDFSYYQQIIDANDLTENCLIHNHFIPHKDLRHYYSSADLVVLPYKRIYQSGVLMMSMSHEKAVIVSNLPPLIEVIKDKETGFVFETENHTSLSNKLNFILSDLSILDNINKNALRLVKKKYDWKEIGMRLKMIYKSIL